MSEMIDAGQMIHTELPALKGGEGGVIVLTQSGPPVWSNNTLGIFHAQQVEGAAPKVWAHSRSTESLGGSMTQEQLRLEPQRRTRHPELVWHRERQNSPS